MVKSRFNRPTTIASPIGDGHSPVYEERIVEGKRKLVQVGADNINEFVQKSLEDTKIYNILAKYENGNIDVLNQMHGEYLDVTSLPKNLAEAHNLIINAHKTFESLPLEVRAKFDHSSDVFLQKVSDGSFMDLFPKQENVDIKESENSES